jgi:hypothetical protein
LAFTAIADREIGVPGYNSPMDIRNLTILVTDGWYCGDDLDEALQAVASGCRVFGEDDLKADPSLVTKAQVV